MQEKKGEDCYDIIQIVLNARWEMHVVKFHLCVDYKKGLLMTQRQLGAKETVNDYFLLRYKHRVLVIWLFA